MDILEPGPSKMLRSCFPYLYINRQKYRTQSPNIRRDISLSNTLEEEQRTMRNIIGFGPKSEFTGEKALLEEYMYTVDMKFQCAVLSPKPGFTLKVADFMFPQSILYHMNWHRGSVDSAGSYRGEYIVENAYDLSSINGPVVDLDSALDTGIWETRIRAEKIASMTPYNQNTWTHNEQVHYRHHRTRQRFYLIARELAQILYHMNRLETIRFDGSTLAMGLFEYADSIARFSLSFCEFDHPNSRIRIEDIDFSLWRPIKWDIHTFEGSQTIVPSSSFSLN